MITQEEKVSGVPCTCEFCTKFHEEANAFYRRVALLGIETNTRPTAAVMAMGIAVRAFAEVYMRRHGGTLERHLEELTEFFNDGLNTAIAIPDNLMPTPESMQ